MSQSSQPQATVITGPQGSSDVPVPHPGTAPAGSIPPQHSNLVGSVPSQQTPSSGSVPSQHTSSGGSVPFQQEPTSGSVPSQQVPPARSVPPQQTSLSETGSEEDDFPLPPPLLPLPMDPGLREVLDRQAEPFTLPKDQSSSVPPTERILEDPRIQTVLNGIYQWAIKNKIPTESLFGDHISSPRHPGTPLLKRDIDSVKQNLPPAIPRPSGLSADLQRVVIDHEEFPRSPQLNSDYLVSSLLIPPRVPDSIPIATDSTTAAARPFPLPKVRPLGSSAKAVPDPGDYLPFMKEFSIWSKKRTVRPRSFQLSQPGITTLSWIWISLEPIFLVLTQEAFFNSFIPVQSTSGSPPDTSTRSDGLRTIFGCVSSYTVNIRMLMQPNKRSNPPSWIGSSMTPSPAGTIS
ncbi:hypothetical protein RCL1_006289 [Eukaryota sp. TZLM3-RCL]